MGSIWLSSGSLFLVILCASSSPTSNEIGTGIISPSDKGSINQQPRNEHSVQPGRIQETQNLESPNKHLYSRQESNVVGCGLHILEPGQNVTIRSSRDSKGKYPANEDCRWAFQATSDESKLTISCGLFKLRGCRHSSLRITGGGQSKRICRRRPKLTKKINGNAMTVYFRTSSSKKRRKGFSCTVSASVPPVPAGPCRPCGTVNRVSRIVGGVETEVNEYPWQVALVSAGTNDVICGGSLVNDLVVLTSAYCIQEITRIGHTEVLLGAHDLQNPTPVQQRLGIESMTHPPPYNPATNDHDIGYIWLLTPATLSERVKPVCLPNTTKDYTDSVAVTSGWGTLSEGGNPSSILNEMEAPIISSITCAISYPSMTERQMCAGYTEGDIGPCRGDYGGPLVVEENGLWFLVGIASHATGCARYDYPAVFTVVDKFLDQISALAQRGGNSLCDSNGY